MSLLSPSSVAVIGASAEEQKVGHYVLKNLLGQGFQGQVYPVNPKGGEILGKKTYVDLQSIEGEVDLAVIVTPAKTVPALADACGKKGVKTLVVISAGFGELGTDEGHALESELVATARTYNMQLIGPNCLGVLRPAWGVNISFANNLPRKGSIALLSQSGAMAVAVMDAAEGLGIDFSLVVSMGNKAATDECDLLELCLNDPETKVIGMYLESVKDGTRFLSIAKEVCKKKPVVLIKAGTSEHGRAAVSSHTGALAGSDAAIDAVCAQTGIRRAHTTEEFMDMLRVLSTQPALPSPNVAVITNAGGPGILATDAAERNRLKLISLDEKNRDALKSALPPAASAANPIDVLGDASTDRYAAAISAAMNDPNVDGIVVLLTPQVMTPEEEIAKAIIAGSRFRPLLPIVTSFMGEQSITKAAKILEEAHIPNFPTPERAVAALATLLPKEPVKQTELPACNASMLAKTLLKDKKGALDEDTVRELFSLYKLPLPSSGIATSAKEAAKLAKEMGYPVVAKVSSPDILHKTDVGGVRTNLQNAKETEQAYAEILANAKKAKPNADIKGVLIQKFLPAGSEFIVGSVKDPSFGHLVMAGIGGIYTELFRDTCFRIAPIAENDAYEMLQSLRSWKLLLGMRGKGASDIDGLANIIAAVSHLVSDCPEIVELDLNPVLVWENTVIIADAKVVIG